MATRLETSPALVQRTTQRNMAKRKRTKQRAGGPKMAVPSQRRVVTAPARPPRPPKAVAAPKPSPAPPAPAPAPARADDRTALVGAGIVTTLAFVLYAVTVQPSVPPGDSGELISAA